MSSVHAKCSVNLILIMFITLIIFGEENKSKSPSVCSVLPTLILGSDILSSAIFSDTVALSKDGWGTKFALEEAQVYIYSFFNLGARWGWVVNATHRPLYPW